MYSRCTVAVEFKQVNNGKRDDISSWHVCSQCQHHFRDSSSELQSPILGLSYHSEIKKRSNVNQLMMRLVRKSKYALHCILLQFSAISNCVAALISSKRQCTVDRH